MQTLRVAENILDLIGNTPMLKLHNLVPEGSADVFVKLESFNPGFSVKDRAALGMVLRAEKDGSLKPGDTIVEATAGNTGVGLALVGVQRGYKVVFFVPEKFSKEKVMLMEAFGAQVVRTPTEKGMKKPFDAPANSRRHSRIIGSPRNSRTWAIPTSTMKPPARKSSSKWKAASMRSASAPVRAEHSRVSLAR